MKVVVDCYECEYDLGDVVTFFYFKPGDISSPSEREGVVVQCSHSNDPTKGVTIQSGDKVRYFPFRNIVGPIDRVADLEISHEEMYTEACSVTFADFRNNY